MRTFALFGSTFVCEHAFSLMKNTKTPERAKLTNEHVQTLLRLQHTEIEPNFD
jgi:hypothetical protein